MAMQSQRLQRSEKGAVAVEFALIAPLLLLLVFGIIEFGRAYNAKVELTAAVREGVRELALGSGDGVTSTLNGAPGLESSDLAVTTSGSPCTAGSASWVEASYPFSINIPFWGSPTLDIQARGVMRCGG